MYRILIAGCGYTGLAIARHFRLKKQKVWGLIRTPVRRQELESRDIIPVVADLTKPETLCNIPDVSFVVIAVSPDERSDDAYRKIYLKGIENFLKALRKKFPPSLIVYLSSTGVYGDKRGAWVDEDTPPEPDHERGRILLEAERQILQSGFPTVVLRLAGIYGPGRSSLQRLMDNSRRAEMNANEYVNMIHREDIAQMTAVIFKKSETGSIYLGVDDEPVLRGVFYDWLIKKRSLRGGVASPSSVIANPQKADEAISGFGTGPAISKSGLPRPYRACNDGSTISGKRCSNKKIKSLGYSFKFPTFREGYEALLASR